MRERAHRPTAVDAKTELGTSSAMLQISLSVKKSPVVNWKLLIVPSTSKKKGSLRQPAKNGGHQPASGVLPGLERPVLPKREPSRRSLLRRRLRRQIGA